MTHRKHAVERSFEHSTKIYTNHKIDTNDKHVKMNSLKNETEMPTWPM